MNPKVWLSPKPKTQSFSQITQKRVPKRPLESLAAVGSSSLTVEWGYLRQSIEVYSMEEIVRKLDGGQERWVKGMRRNTSNLASGKTSSGMGITNVEPPIVFWKEAASDLQERFTTNTVFSGNSIPLNDVFASRKTWHSVVKTILGAQTANTIQSACLKLIHHISNPSMCTNLKVDFLLVSRIPTNEQTRAQAWLQSNLTSSGFRSPCWWSQDARSSMCFDQQLYEENVCWSSCCRWREPSCKLIRLQMEVLLPDRNAWLMNSQDATRTI